MRRTALHLFLASSMAGICSAQYRGQEFRATIVLSDGTPFRTIPSIVPERFGLCRILDIFGNGNLSYTVANPPIASGEAIIDDCAVTIRLSGYQTMRTTLHDRAVITLKRVGDAGSGTVSVTEADAPDKARRAYGKGLDAMTARKLAAAAENFQKAVDIYPKYAAAWTALGVLLQQEGKPDAARTDFERAIAEDPQFLKPYTMLALMALAEGKDADVIAMAERASKGRAGESAYLAWACAQAQFHLKELDSAERTTQRAIELDSEHHIPRAEHLLGEILETKGDAAGAVRAYTQYLKYSPDAPDRAQVEQSIAGLSAGAAAK